MGAGCSACKGLNRLVTVYPLQLELSMQVQVEQIIAEQPWVGLLTQTQLLEMRNAFSKFDRDMDGHIEAKELMGVMRSCGLLPTEDNVNELLRSVDLNDNGRIEFREFLVIVARRIIEEDGKVELQQAFKLLDQDGNGIVDLAEARHLLTSAGTQPFTEKELEEFIRLADPDGNGRIPFEDFASMECWRIPALPPPPGPRVGFCPGTRRTRDDAVDCSTGDDEVHEAQNGSFSGAPESFSTQSHLDSSRRGGRDRLLDNAKADGGSERLGVSSMKRGNSRTMSTTPMPAVEPFAECESGT